MTLELSKPANDGWSLQLQQRGAADDVGDDADQRGGRHRLGDVGGEAGGEGAVAIFLAGVGGERHCGDAAAVGALKPESAGVEEAAAWVATVRIMLNLDEFLTRE